MNGLIARDMMVGGGLLLLVGLVGGCCCTKDLYDPCWPERYTAMADREVREPACTQAHNGHILDQTIWNCGFVPGTDQLTPGGMSHLVYLTQRRPCPDPKVYLQTAQDIPYDPEHPEMFAEKRCELDAKRIAAIQKYLTAQTAGCHIDFQVCVLNTAEPEQSAVPVGLAIQRMYSGAQGVLVGAAATATGGAGAGPR